MNFADFRIGARLVLLSALMFMTRSWAQQAMAPERAPLTQDEQAKLLASMRVYAEEYTSNLPNFICDLTLRQFQAGKNAKHWKRGDTLVSQLVFNEGREQRNLKRVNNQPPKPGARRRAPLKTEGEFGILMSNILEPASNATFTWRGWEFLRGKWLAVFDFAIDREHSTLKLILGDLGQAIVPYRGSVYTDPANSSIWRVLDEATDIPPKIQTKSITTTVDYGYVPIGKREYLLPVSALVQLDTGSGNVKHEMEFGSYRKFESSSTITYSAEGAHEKGSPNPPQ